MRGLLTDSARLSEPDLTEELMADLTEAEAIDWLETAPTHAIAFDGELGILVVKHERDLYAWGYHDERGNLRGRSGTAKEAIQEARCWDGA